MCGCKTIIYLGLLCAAALGCSKNDKLLPEECEPFSPPPAHATDPTWAPGRDRIAFVAGFDALGSYSPGIYLVDTTGSPRSRLAVLDPLRGPQQLAWSPDGSRIAFIYGLELWTVSVLDGSMLRWPLPHRFVSGPGWAPDGRFLVYEGSRNSTEPDTAGGLHILDTMDGTQRALLNGSRAIWGSEPVWSPDGASIAFVVVESEGRATNIFTARADGTGYRRLTSYAGFARNPQWLSGSERIVFSTNEPPCVPNQTANHTTWAINADGSGLTQWPVLLSDPRVQFGYQFELSRDGVRTVFVGLDSTRTAGVVTVMNVDGTERRELISRNPAVHSSRWGYGTGFLLGELRGR